MKPIDVKSHEQVLKLDRDNIESGDFWMILDYPFVVICEQPAGENIIQKMKIPVAIFNKFARWYVTGKKIASPAVLSPTKDTEE